jgi:hypothetical protein
MTQRNRPRGCPRSPSAFEVKLEALVGQAFELRDSPYLRDAVEAIVEHHDRRALTEFERRQQQLADLRRLLRETAPRRAGIERRDAA